MSEAFKHVPVTVSVEKDGYSIRVTQRYCQEFNTGHYMFAIMDTDGNIVDASRSIGGAPDGKISVAKAEKLLDDWRSEYDRFGG